MTTASTTRRSPADPVRRSAIDALVRIEGDGAYANLALPAMLGRSSLDPRQRAAVTDLVYGTTRLRRACDWLGERHLSRRRSMAGLDPPVAAALRIGVYQLVFAGTAPHAAVSATVGAAPKRAQGLVNAVLRRVADEVGNGQQPPWPDDATRLSYPDWIVERLIQDLGRRDALAALEVMNRPPSVTARGDGYVQDDASRLVVDAMEARSHHRVVDVCAAPGGKATDLAGRGARVAAGDWRAGRVRLIAANAATLGLDRDRLSPMVADGRRPPLRPQSLDRVLVDAPCSGLGVLRRRPDARWRVQPHSVDRLADLQVELLTAAADVVAPGGLLVYSVCTLTAAETTGVADRVPLPGFEPLEPPSPPWTSSNDATTALLLPQAADTDGMALARWRRA